MSARLVSTAALVLAATVTAAPPEVVVSPAGEPAGSPSAMTALTQPLMVAGDATAGWPKFGGGASILFMRPRFESNPAYTVTSITSQGPGNPTRTSRQVTEFDYDFGTAFRTWVGFQGPGGFGLRARWFLLDQAAPALEVANNPLQPGGPVLARTVASTSPLLAIGPQTALPAVFAVQSQAAAAPPSRTTVTSNLRMSVWDVEGTLGGLTLGRADLVFAGGVRFADIRQQYAATLAGFPAQYLVSEQAYTGAGPTIAAEGRAPVGLLGVTAYGSGRVSLTYGEDRHHVYGTNLGLTPPFDLASHDDTSFHKRFLPAFDFEMGVEKAVPLGRFLAVVNAGVVGALWPVGGGAQPNGNMGLFGFVVGGELRY